MRSYNNNFFLKKNCQVSRLRQLSNEYIQVKMQNKNSMYHSEVKKKFTCIISPGLTCWTRLFFIFGPIVWVFEDFSKEYKHGVQKALQDIHYFCTNFLFFERFGWFNVCIFFRIRLEENLPMTSKCRAVCCDIILRLGRRQSRCMFLIAYIM